MSSIYEALNTAQQRIINKSTNDALLGVINNTIPRDGRKLLQDSRDNYVNAGASQLLETVGININNTVPKYTPIISKAYQSAKNIMNAKLDNGLNDKTFKELLDYRQNESTQYHNSPIGFLATEVNNITDIQATLTLSDAPNTLYNNPALTTDILKKTNPSYTPLDNTNNPNNPNNTNPTNSNSANSNKYGPLSGKESYSTILNSFIPKAKFLFIVHFTFNDKDLTDNFSLLVHKFDRPEITVEHDEINFYNFKTFVPKATKYGPLNLEFHDDQANMSLNFLVSYLRRISPLFNQKSGANLEIDGLNFENASSSYGLHTKGIENNVTLINNITVYHLYNYCNTMDVHIFNNPKIEKASMNELNMAEASTGSAISLTLNYDNYYLDTGVAAKIPDNILNISELQAMAPMDLTSQPASYDSKYANLLNIEQKNEPTDDKTYAKSPVPIYDENGEMIDSYTPLESLNKPFESGLKDMNKDQISTAILNNLYNPTMVNDLNTMNNKPINNIFKIPDTISPTFLSSALKE